jgi:Lipopolysaccharide-assembly
MKNVALICLSFLVMGCANYKMGNTPKGAGLANIRVLYVPTAQNETDETAVPGTVTNAILQELDRDGTYRHARKDECDAILEVTVKRIERTAIRQSTEQFLTTLQFQLILSLEYRLYDVKEKKEVFPKTTVTGTTTFFVQGDQTESQRQALPLAAQSAAQNLVNALANRGW